MTFLQIKACLNLIKTTFLDNVLNISILSLKICRFFCRFSVVMCRFCSLKISEIGNCYLNVFAFICSFRNYIKRQKNDTDLRLNI